MELEVIFLRVCVYVCRWMTVFCKFNWRCPRILQSVIDFTLLVVSEPEISGSERGEKEETAKSTKIVFFFYTGF